MTLARAHGHNATIDLFERHLLITRLRGGLLANAPVLEQFIPLSSIKSVQFTRPAFMSRGKIAFTLEGNPTVRSGLDAGGNIVHFDAHQAGQFEFILQAIQNAIAAPSVEPLPIGASRNQPDPAQGGRQEPKVGGGSGRSERSPDNDAGAGFDGTAPYQRYATSHSEHATASGPPLEPTYGAWWRGLPLLGKIALIAFALIVLLDMCSGDVSEMPGATAGHEVTPSTLMEEESTAALAQVKSGETAPDANQKIIDGCYHLDDCRAYKLIRTQRLERIGTESLIKAVVVPGEVQNASGDASDMQRMRWATVEEEIYALCSAKRPTIAFATDGAWMAQELDLASGIPGMMQNSANVYQALCHGFFGNELEGQAAALGYVPLNGGGRGQFTIRAPGDLLSP